MVPKKVRIIVMILMAVSTSITWWLISSMTERDTACDSQNGHLCSSRKDAGSVLHAQRIPQRMPRVLCLVLATEMEVLKVEAVNKTWTRRCDKTLFLYGSANETHLQGDKLFINVSETMFSLPGKVKAAFQLAHKYFNSSFDWILKADVDTYVIMENLRLLLSTKNPNQSILMGHHFTSRWPNKIGFMHGGASYVLSARALRDLALRGIGAPRCNFTVGSEDIQIALCLESLNVTVWSSLDIDRKETFHVEPLGYYFSPPFTNWLKTWSWNKAKFGPDCCGNFSISFHHLKPSEIYVYEHLLYNTKVNTGPLRQNVFPDTTEMIERNPMYLKFQ